MKPSRIWRVGGVCFGFFRLSVNAAHSPIFLPPLLFFGGPRSVGRSMSIGHQWAAGFYGGRVATHVLLMDNLEKEKNMQFHNGVFKMFE